MSNTIEVQAGNFSMTPNSLLNNSGISLTAKGLYAFMRGKPPAWNFTIRSMAKQLKEGETAIRNALSELRGSGWVVYVKRSNGTGVYQLLWDGPKTEEPSVDNQVMAEPKPENPNVGNPMKGKPTRISKKEPIARKIDKEPIVELKPDVAEKVIQYLNDKSGRQYKAVPSNKKLIEARIKEGATPKDLVAVINRKCAEWLDNPEMAQYLRPSTLFGATNFNNYVGQLNTPLPAKRADSSNPAGIDFNSTGWMR